MLFKLCSGNVEDNMRINEVLFSKISRIVKILIHLRIREGCKLCMKLFKKINKEI
jgi:hypothetical protein